MNLQVLETVKTEYIKLRDKYQKKAIKEREKVNDVYVMVCGENTKLKLSEAIRYMKKDRKNFFRKRSGQGTGMSRSVITPNLSENLLVLGTSGKSRKNKIVPLNEFSFDLLPQKWLSIQKVIDDNGKEKVVFWYEL